MFSEFPLLNKNMRKAFQMLRADLAGKFLLVGLVIERIIEISIYKWSQLLTENSNSVHRTRPKPPVADI